MPFERRPRLRPPADGDAPAARRGRPPAALVALVALGALALGGCGGEPAAPERTPGAPTRTAPGTPAASPVDGPPGGPVDGPTEAARPVRTVRAEIDTLEAVKSVSATVSAARESRVAAGSSGRVVAVDARPGTRVDAGQAVLRLDDESARRGLHDAELALESARVNLAKAQRQQQEGVAQLQSQVRSAEASLELARARYEEAERLLQAGGVAATEVKALEAQWSQAESALLQARDALARSERAASEDLRLLELQVEQARSGLQRARDGLDETLVRAPFAGVVAELYAEQGEFLAAGAPAFRLLASDETVARFSVPPEDAAALQAQGQVYLRYAGLDHAARITRASRAEQQPRLVELTAALYPSDTPVPTGSVAEVRYRVPLGSGVVVPSGALSADGGETYVYEVDTDAGRAARRRVTVVAEAGARALVEGLEVGARVISPRPLDVRDGTRVTPSALDGNPDGGENDGDGVGGGGG